MRPWSIGITAAVVLAGAAVWIIGPAALAGSSEPHFTVAATADYPYVAKITADLGGTSGRGCSGALIQSRWVLTAAHCVFDPESGKVLGPKAFTLTIGREVSDREGYKFRVQRVVVHPNFPKTADLANVWPADAALLRLNRKADRPALKLAKARPADGTAVRLIGWGCPDESLDDCQTDSTHLKQMPTAVRSNRACGLGGAFVLFNICTSLEGGSSVVRHGDSGGPMVVSSAHGDRLAAVITGSNDDNDVLCSVPDILPWITEVTRVKGAA